MSLLKWRHRSSLHFLHVIFNELSLGLISYLYNILYHSHVHPFCRVNCTLIFFYISFYHSIFTFNSVSVQLLTWALISQYPQPQCHNYTCTLFTFSNLYLLFTNLAISQTYQCPHFNIHFLLSIFILWSLDLNISFFVSLNISQTQSLNCWLIVTHLTNVMEPTSFMQVTNIPKWQVAVQIEFGWM